MSIDVFDFNHHPETGLINIPTGKTISDLTMNVEKSYEFGNKKLQEFECILTGCYHNSISRIIIRIMLLKMVLKQGVKKVLEPKN